MNREVNSTHIGKYISCAVDRDRIMAILARNIKVYTRVSVAKTKSYFRTLPLRHFNIDDAIKAVESENNRNPNRENWYKHDDILEKLRFIRNDVNMYRVDGGLIPDSSDVWENRTNKSPIVNVGLAKRRKISHLENRSRRRNEFRIKYNGKHRDCSVSLGEDLK